MILYAAVKAAYKEITTKKIKTAGGQEYCQKRNFLATSRGVALCPCGVTEVRRPGAWIKADLRAMRYFLAHPEV